MSTQQTVKITLHLYASILPRHLWLSFYKQLSSLSSHFYFDTRQSHLSQFTSYVLQPTSLSLQHHLHTWHSSILPIIFCFLSSSSYLLFQQTPRLLIVDLNFWHTSILSSCIFCFQVASGYFSLTALNITRRHIILLTRLGHISLLTSRTLEAVYSPFQSSKSTRRLGACCPPRSCLCIIPSGYFSQVDLELFTPRSYLAFLLRATFHKSQIQQSSPYSFYIHRSSLISDYLFYQSITASTSSNTQR